MMNRPSRSSPKGRVRMKLGSPEEHGQLSQQDAPYSNLLRRTILGDSPLHLRVNSCLAVQPRVEAPPGPSAWDGPRPETDPGRVGGARPCTRTSATFAWGPRRRWRGSPGAGSPHLPCRCGGHPAVPRGAGACRRIATHLCHHKEAAARVLVADGGEDDSLRQVRRHEVVPHRDKSHWV